MDSKISDKKAIIKVIEFNSEDLHPLNVPCGWEKEATNKIRSAFIKTASLGDKDDTNGFDIREAISKHPDNLFVKIFAIKEDTPNSNGDYFPKEELRKAASTFIGVPLFTNHKNDDIEQAKGKCVHAWYDPEAKGIYIIGRVDKVAYPKLARGIEDGYVQGCSMGTMINYSVCSICHNRATTPDEYCSHINNKRGNKSRYTGSSICQYHSHKEVKDSDECPICKTASPGNSLRHSSQTIYEINYGLKFIENSFVVDPAEETCGVIHIYSKDEIDGMAKQSQQIKKGLINKTAGPKELEKFADIMKDLEYILKSMLSQKDIVSMEFVSDVADLLKTTQASYDELVEAGYGQIPSPPGIDNTAPNDAFSSPASQVNIPGAESEIGNQQNQVNQTNPIPYGGSEIRDLGDMGRVTFPKAAQKEDFSKENIITNNKTYDNEFITDKNIGDRMKDNTKISQNNTEDSSTVILEKQLDGKMPLHSRTSDVENVISQKQLDKSEENSSRGETPTSITDSQLGMDSESVVRFSEMPDVITEKQWTDSSRSVAAKIADDYNTVITQKQIDMLLSNYKMVGSPSFVTEKQLSTIEMPDRLKWANSEYPKDVVKVAMSSCSDLINKYSVDDIKGFLSCINEDPVIRKKVAALSVINSLFHKLSSFNKIENGENRFFVQASQSRPMVDDFIFSIASNAICGVSPFDVLDNYQSVIDNKSLFKKIKSEASVKKSVNKKTAIADAIGKLSEGLSDGKIAIMSTKNEVRSAVKSSDTFLSGIKKIAQMTIEEEGVAIEESLAVINIGVDKDGNVIIEVEDGGYDISENDIDNGIIEYISEETENDYDISDDDGMEKQGTESDVVEIEVSDENSKNDDDDENDDENDDDDDEKDKGDDDDDDDDDDEKDKDDEDEDDDERIEIEIEDDGYFEKKEASGKKTLSKTNLQSQREKAIKMEKIAQMFGGEMGGQGDASQMPGAGATLPGTGGMDAPPVESFTDDMPVAGEDTFEEDVFEVAPPGTICPACGSKDVDIVDGVSRCNNCPAKWTTEVAIKFINYPEVTPESADNGKSEDMEGEGLAVDIENEQMPVAASILLNNKIMKKVAEMGIQLGDVSPATGKLNTIKIDNAGYRQCLDTGTKYKVAFITTKDKKQSYMRYEWKVRPSFKSEACNRRREILKEADVKSILNASFNESIKVASAISKSLNVNKQITKIAKSQNDVIESFKSAYAIDKSVFPEDICKAVINRRFGENAVALSGPGEGKPLAEVVSSALKEAGIYTNKIAMKVAEIWSDKSATDECIETLVRKGHEMKEAMNIVPILKISAAEDIEFLEEQLSIPEGDFTPDGDDDDFVDDGFDDVVDVVDVYSDDVEISYDPTDVIRDLLDDVKSAIEVASDKIDSKGIEDEPIEDEVIEDEPIEDEVIEDEVIEDEPIENEDGIEDEVIEDETIENEDGIDDSLGFTDDKDFVTAKDISNRMSKGASSAGGYRNISFEKLAQSLESARKTVELKNVQDVEGLPKQKSGDGSYMGDEKNTIPQDSKPNVPRNKATMGDEDDSLNPQDKPLPEIPTTSDATIGGERDAGLSGGDYNMTGGQEGAGNSKNAKTIGYDYKQSTIDRQNKLIDRVVEAQQSINKKKVKSPLPVSETSGIPKIKGPNGSVIGGEEKFNAEEIDRTDRGNESMIGAEQEAIGDKPASPKDHPEIATGDALMGNESKDINSEKTDEAKGTVYADSSRVDAAFKVASMMLKQDLITPDEMQSKVVELQQYKVSQINDFAKAIEKMAKKSVKVASTASKDAGFTQAVVIGEDRSQTSSRDGDLISKLSKAWTVSGGDTLPLK